VIPEGAKLTGGAGGSAGPSSAQAGAYGSGLNSSGWQVNFSGTQTAGFASGEGPGGGIVEYWRCALVGLGHCCRHSGLALKKIRQLRV
jgi:hypothetical protein